MNCICDNQPVYCSSCGGNLIEHLREPTLYKLKNELLKLYEELGKVYFGIITNSADKLEYQKFLKTKAWELRVEITNTELEIWKIYPHWNYQNINGDKDAF